MFRMSATAFAALIALTLGTPATVWAGAGPPGNTIVVPPVFDSAGTSGMITEAPSNGYSVGYNLNTAGPAVGSGTLNQNPDYRNAGGPQVGYPDLDGNGITDLVRVNSAGNIVATLFSDAGTWVSEISSGNILNLPAGFVILGWPDLNGDGNDDLVIQDSQTGASIGYLMNGLTVTSSGQLPGLPAQGGYSTIGFPDLDGINGADLAIQSSSGFTFAYILTDGLNDASSGQIPGAPDANAWSTIGFPDLDGNGTADIALQEAGGFTFAALMNGLTESSRGQIPGLPAGQAGWTTIGFPDLDAQNGGDIVSQHSGGYTIAALLNGTATLSGPTAIRGLPAGQAGWSTIGFPQLDGANGADYVMRHSGGYTFGVLMNGLSEDGSGVLPSQNSSIDALEWEQAWAVLP